jgi:hypothetical protein
MRGCRVALLALALHVHHHCTPHQMPTRPQTPPAQGAILCVRIATFMGIAWLIAFFALKFTQVSDCTRRHHKKALASSEITSVISAAEESSHSTAQLMPAVSLCHAARQVVAGPEGHLHLVCLRRQHLFPGVTDWRGLRRPAHHESLQIGEAVVSGQMCAWLAL